jgi:hypothetical protein
MAWLPTAKADVERVALPEDRLAVPKVEAPSRKVTVPVGTPVPEATALTVAVNVTAWPDADGFTELVIVVVLFALFTVCVMAADVLPLKLASPA